ncbi:MAG: MBL fold metallo-hydrolase [Bauldia sp.]
MAKTPEKQMPGVYKRRIGDAMVTVVNDGFLDMTFEILRGTERSEMEGLMSKVFRPGPPRITVNAFVIETGKNTVLVDAGGGSTTVYSMGLLPENLEAAGFSPSDFDTVLLTHIHPDHSSGLMAPGGRAHVPRGPRSWSTRMTSRSGPTRRSAMAIRPRRRPYLDSADMVIGAYREQFGRAARAACCRASRWWRFPVTRPATAAIGSIPPARRW